MNYLIDVNVWMALTLIGHVHHESAKSWIEDSVADNLLFCRMTQNGLLRLLTNPKVMGPNTVNSAKAWMLYDALFEDERVRFAGEPEGLEKAWREQTQGERTGANFWTDAYLAAFAAAAGYTIVTFDQEFARRRNVDVRVLG